MSILPGASPAVGPTNGGKVTPVNTLSTSPAQVIAGNPNRKTITFHNPGAVDAFVYMLTTATGATLSPSVGSLGGCFLIFGNGGQQTFTGECQLAWGGFSRTGSGNPLTVMESNS